MTKTNFKRVGNSPYSVSHNGRIFWDATVQITVPGKGATPVVLDTNVPISDGATLSMVPVYFKDTPTGRREITEFINKTNKLVVVGEYKANAKGEVSYVQPKRVMLVDFDPSVDVIEAYMCRGKPAYKLWARINKYVA